MWCKEILCCSGVAVWQDKMKWAAPWCEDEHLINAQQIFSIYLKNILYSHDLWINFFLNLSLFFSLYVLLLHWYVEKLSWKLHNLWNITIHWVICYVVQDIRTKTKLQIVVQRKLFRNCESLNTNSLFCITSYL